MATINERLDKLDDVREASANLKDRIEALEKRIQTMNDSMAVGEKQFEFLEDLPDGRCKQINETTQGIAQSVSQFHQVTKDLADPFNQRVVQLTNRIKAMEVQIGISN